LWVDKKGDIKMKRTIKRATAMFMAVVMLMSAAAFTVSAASPAEGMLPVRAIFEDAGAVIDWQEADRTIHIELLGSVIVLYTRQPLATVNNEPMQLQDGILLYDGRAFITQDDVALVNLAIIAAMAQHVTEDGFLASTIVTAIATTEMLMDALDIAGFTMAIVHRDSGFTWTQGFGYADIERGIPVDETTLFDTGSVVKMFNAIALMQMVEQGIIDLDEPIVTYLPDFFVQPHPVHGGDYRDITPRMLLAHISGIEGDFFGGMWSLGAPDPGIMNNTLPRMADATMNNTQMKRMSYANAGTMVLGVLTATMAGHDDYFYGFWQHIEENVWIPAGMYTTTFVPDSDANRALPYISASLPMQEHTYTNPISAGGMFTSAEEMAKFMHIILAGGGDIISQVSLDEMFTIQLDNDTSRHEPMQFGLGTHSVQWANGLVTQGHDGGTTHYLTSMQFHFDSGIGIFLSTNSQTGGGAFMTVMEVAMTAAVQEIMGDVNLLAPRGPGEPGERSREELEALVGFYSGLGWLEINDDGNLQFGNVPGIPVPLELIPYTDGSFGVPFVGVRFWFDELDGSMALFQGEHPRVSAIKRIEGGLWQANENFERWAGTFEYYTESQNSVHIVPYINFIIDESGYAFVNYLGDISSPIGMIDDYTFYVLGSGRNTGLVIRLYESEGEAWLHMSGTRFVRR